MGECRCLWTDACGRWPAPTAAVTQKRLAQERLAGRARPAERCGHRLDLRDAVAVLTLGPSTCWPRTWPRYLAPGLGPRTWPRYLAPGLGPRRHGLCDDR